MSLEDFQFLDNQFSDKKRLFKSISSTKSTMKSIGSKY